MGLAGSLHCFGMCGPISLLVPGDKSKRVRYLLGRLVYNLGRICTYAILGFIVGSVGEQAGFAIPQKIIFLTLGSLILGYLFAPTSLKNKWSVNPFINKANSKIKKTISGLHKKNGAVTQFLFGLVNGLVPCGLVYAALSASFITASSLDAATYMMLFGVGTLPMMLAFGFIGSYLPSFLRIKPTLVYSVSYFLLAVFMLYKGFTLPVTHFANSHEMTICKGK